MSNEIQLRLIREVSEVLGAAGVEFWVRGGWALDFHLGEVTREHDDVDLVAWLEDGERIWGLLETAGYVHAPLPNDRPELGLRLRKDDEEVAFVYVEHTVSGALVTRGYEQWPWPTRMLDGQPKALRGATCCVVAADALLDEQQTYHEWSGRPPRPKDLESTKLLRRLVEDGEGE